MHDEGLPLPPAFYSGRLAGMKAVIFALLSFSLLTTSGFGQATAPREIVKKAVPKDQRTPPAPPASAASSAKTPAQAKTVAPPVKVKTEAEKQEMEKKTVEFLTQRAKGGSASAQYDLALRYLDGKGVEKSEKEGRKWLEAAAKQGDAKAAKKIQELDKKSAATPAK